MRGRPVLTIAVLCLLVIGVLVVHAPSARAAVGPKTIVVDGDPGDWTGVVPLANTGAEDLVAGEYVWNDTSGDDTGSGVYTYPKAGDLNRTGLFDIREVRFTADAQNLYVLIKVANLSNPWGGSDGFSTVAAVLLIDTTRDGNGMLFSRPNVNISAGSGWEYYVKIGQTGWQAESAKVFDRSARLWAPIANKGNAAFHSIEVSVPLAFIGKDGYNINGATWRFMLFLQSHDGFQPDGFRDVRGARFCCDWEFGGGTDGPYDPKIQDLAFSATRIAQEAELASYTAAGYATVSSSVDVTFGNVGFAPDTTPPLISAVAATPTFNQADISWTTDEIANTTVWYGPSPPPTLRRSIDEFVTSHSVTLSGLDPRTTYSYQVESCDIAGNCATTSVATFTTQAPPPADIASWAGNWFVWEDSRGDDTGDGNYVYPNEPTVRWQGRGDLWFVNMTREGNWNHYAVRLNARAETIWRQRMAGFAMFIDQDHVAGSGATSAKFIQAESDPGHPLNVSVAPEFAWEWMVVATLQNYSEFTPGDYRGELLLRNSAFDVGLNTYSLVYISTNPASSPEPRAGMVQSTNGGTQLDFWLNRSVVGASDNWTYVAVGALYDDAGGGWPNGGIRQVRPTAATWEGGGANGPMNPNIYDLAFYPTTAAQERDLSEYVSTAYTSITYAMQVDLGARWHQMLFVQNVLAVTSFASVTTLNAGESAGIATFVTNRNSPVGGVPVTLTANPAGVVDVQPPNPAPTNAFGAALFTVRARAVSADTDVVITASSTVGGSTAAQDTTITVRAPVIPHTYGVFLAAADGVLSTGGQTSVIVTFTDKGAPIVGAGVALSSSSTTLTVLTASATTNAEGRATFTVRAGYTETDVAATLTATATNASVPTTGTAMVTVKAFVHAYALSGSAGTTVVPLAGTTILTFTARDAGAARAGVAITITVSDSNAFEIVGNAQTTTTANGQATFTLRAKPVASDTPVTVTASASNGSAANVASATVTVVAQAAPAAGGVSTDVFAGVSAGLVLLAVVFAVLWLMARRRGKPPETGTEPPSTGEGTS